MNHDEDVVNLLKRAADEEPVSIFDTDALMLAAHRRRRRRRVLTAAAVAAVTVCAVTSITLASLPSRSHDAHTHSGGPTAAAPQRLGPGCGLGAAVTVPNTKQGDQGDFAVLASTTAKSAASVTASVSMDRPVTIVDAQIYVDPPSLAIGASGAQQEPAWTTRQQNALVESNIVSTRSATTGNPLTVAFMPNEAGTYPVFYVLHYIDTKTCDPTGGTIRSDGPLGVISVQ